MRLSDSYALEESVLADIGVFVEHQNIHGSLPKIWQSWQTEIIKGNYANQKQKKIKKKKLSNKKKLEIAESTILVAIPKYLPGRI